MPFDFPSSPTTGDIYTLGGTTYTWDGQVWRAYADTTSNLTWGIGLEERAAAPGTIDVKPANFAGEIGGVTVVARSMLNGLAYDLLTGALWAPPGTDTLPGVMTEPPPDGAPYARRYDGSAASWAPAGSSIAVADAPPPLVANQLWWDSDSGNLFVAYQDADSLQWVQININAPPTTGIAEAPLDGQPYNRQSGAWVVDTQTTALDAYTKVESDARFLQLTGGALTGSIDFSTPDQGPAQSVLRGLVGSSLCAEIQYKHEYSTFGQWWFYIGGFWVFHTARGASVPGINVNGDVSASSITDRTVVNNELPPAVIEPFIEGEGEERGVNLGKLLIHAMCEITALKSELAALKGAR